MMVNYNFINYVKILDLSLLNFIDYIDYTNDSQSLLFYNDIKDQIQINLNAKSKKLLTSFILNNISDVLYYNNLNIIINPCKPSNNWRQNKEKKINTYKYTLADKSIYIDLLEFNKFADDLYKKLPKMTMEYKNISKYNNDYIDVENLKNITLYKNNIKYIEFEELDIWDAYVALKTYLIHNGTLNFDNLSYNIIEDGNHDYIHDSVVSDDIKENIRLKLIEQGVI